jgi:hypothetical protein
VQGTLFSLYQTKRGLSTLSFETRHTISMFIVMTPLQRPLINVRSVCITQTSRILLTEYDTFMKSTQQNQILKIESHQSCYEKFQKNN